MAWHDGAICWSTELHICIHVVCNPIVTVVYYQVTSSMLPNYYITYPKRVQNMFDALTVIPALYSSMYVGGIVLTLINLDASLIHFVRVSRAEWSNANCMKWLAFHSFADITILHKIMIGRLQTADMYSTLERKKGGTEALHIIVWGSFKLSEAPIDATLTSSLHADHE